MRQALQVIWLHICKNMEKLRQKLVSDIELGNSTSISDEARTSAKQNVGNRHPPPNLQAQKRQRDSLKEKKWNKHLEILAFQV